MIEREISYVVDGLEHKGFVAHQASSAPRPAILISHAWGGLDDFCRNKARELASLGYVGCAIDMYGEGKTGSCKEENAALMTPLLENRKLLSQRIGASLEAMKELDAVDQDSCSAIGFCFGGLCVLDLARSGADLKSVVSFHGLLGKPPFPSQSIKAKVLVLHGYNDPMVTPKDVADFEREMNDAACDWQVHSYGQTMHAFTHPEANDEEFGTVFSKEANDRSWQTLKNFLEETVG